MEHFAEVWAAQPFAIERAALRAQLIFFSLLLINKGRNNGNQETLQFRQEIRQGRRQVSKKRNA
jgi:hypothetical protein